MNIKANEESARFMEATGKCIDKGPAYTNALIDKYALKGLTRDDVIVRFLSLENFLRMVNSQCNVLARVATWKDVYEGYVLRLSYQDCNVANQLQDFYGQCWTKRKTDSEVLWNARCPNGYGVCLKTTVGKLAKSITAQCSSADDIGGVGCLDAVVYDKTPVDYSHKKPNAENIRDFLSNHQALLRSFFLKRYEFNDENEVRVILDLPQNAHGRIMQRTYSGDLMFYKLNRPEDFVDEVMFHPLMDDLLCDRIKLCVQCKGWNNVKIERSHLYDLPKGTLTLFERKDGRKTH